MSTVTQRYNEAEKLKDQKRNAEAIEILTGILTDEPDHVLTHLTLARLYTTDGRHLEAIEHAEKACALEPNEWYNFTVLSVTYQRAYAGMNEHRYIAMAEDAMARSRTLNH